MPDASSPHATSTSVAATSPTRSGTPRARRPAILLLSPETSDGPGPSRKRSSPRLPENVADTAQRVQKPLLTGVDLAAKVGDVGLHHVVVTAEVVAPRVVEDFRLGQHRARVDDEVVQQGEFGGRKRAGIT